MPRFYRPIGFYSISFETWVTLVENVECWVIWMWWSDGLHIIVEEELGDDTLVDVGVGTQGYSGLVTPADIRVLTPSDTGVHNRRHRFIHTRRHWETLLLHKNRISYV